MSIFHADYTTEDTDGLGSHMTSPSSMLVGNGDLETFSDPLNANVQIQDHRKYQEEMAACQSWDHLKDVTNVSSEISITFKLSSLNIYYYMGTFCYI